MSDAQKPMVFKFWLVFDANGGVRVTKQQPALKSYERSMFMTAVLPWHLFQLPELRGSITIPDQGPEPFRINIEAASAALKSAIGVDIDLYVNSATPEPAKPVA